MDPSNETIQRMKNVLWFAGLRQILDDHENPVNDTERYQTIEAIYQLTLKEFKQ